MEAKQSEIETLIVDTNAKNDKTTIPLDKFQRNLNNNKKLIDYLCFATFLFQTSSVVLLIRYSRIQNSNNESYATASIITCAEIGKIFVGILCCLYDYNFRQNKSTISSIKSVYNDIFGDKKTLFLMSVPSLIYSVQNFLMYMSLGLIDTSVYQIIVQLKTLTTACFGMCLLSKQYTWIQWISFLLLSVGVIIANFSVIKNKQKIDDEVTKPLEMNYLQYMGLLYALGTTVTSGFAGTFMEMQLKENKNNIFIQNIQLSMFALIGCVINGYITDDMEQIMLYGFFYGFTKIVWIVVFLNVGGGYFVAIVIKRASTIIKTFLSGIAILMVIFESYLLLGDHSVAHFEFFGAVILVLLANYLYNKEKENQRKLSSITV